MLVTVIIPTCSMQRFPLLVNTVKSIKENTYKDVRIVVVADGSLAILQAVAKKFAGITATINNERRDWIYSINHILQAIESDYYIYASDDLIFPPDCIKNAMDIMQKRFPDGDGVVSIGRKNRCIFGLMGDKFVSRFPKRQVFCPDYIHYCSDSELLGTVKRLKRLTHPPDRLCQVRHFREKDGTWRLARQVRKRDRAVHDMRVERGYLWGIDFNRVAE